LPKGAFRVEQMSCRVTSPMLDGLPVSAGPAAGICDQGMALAVP